jgi:hypothetical protein
MNNIKLDPESFFFWKMERAFEKMRMVFYHFRDEWYFQPFPKAVFVDQFRGFILVPNIYHPCAGLCQNGWFPNEKHNNRTSPHKDDTTLRLG